MASIEDPAPVCRVGFSCLPLTFFQVVEDLIYNILPALTKILVVFPLEIDACSTCQSDGTASRRHVEASSYVMELPHFRGRLWALVHKPWLM